MFSGVVYFYLLFLTLFIAAIYGDGVIVVPQGVALG